MGEYFPAEISIGGPVRRGYIPGLLHVIGRAGVGLQYGGDSFKPVLPAHLQEAATKDEDGHLVLCSSEAEYGQFPELEEFLRKNGIAFDRHSDARDEFSAEEVCFRHGKGRPEVFQCDKTTAEKYVSRGAVLRAIRYLEKDKPVTALRVLRSAAKPGIQKLAPFEIVDRSSGRER